MSHTLKLVFKDVNYVTELSLQLIYFFSLHNDSPWVTNLVVKRNVESLDPLSNMECSSLQ